MTGHSLAAYLELLDFTAQNGHRHDILDLRLPFSGIIASARTLELRHGKGCFLPTFLRESINFGQGGRHFNHSSPIQARRHRSKAYLIKMIAISWALSVIVSPYEILEVSTVDLPFENQDPSSGG